MKPPGTAFVNPTSLPGLKLWLDAGFGVTQSGGTVSAWADRSGNGNDVAQTTSSSYKPAYTASAINSLPGITFAYQKVLTNTTTNLVTGGAARTVFAVCKTSVEDLQTVISFRPSNGETTYSFDLMHPINVNPDGLSCFVYGDALEVYERLSDDPSLYGDDAISEWSYSGVDEDPVLWKFNGTSFARLSGQVSNPEDGYTGFMIGADAEGPLGGANFNGPICEVIVYDRVLSSSDALLVRQYLGTKYGITVV